MLGSTAEPDGRTLVGFPPPQLDEAMESGNHSDPRAFCSLLDVNENKLAVSCFLLLLGRNERELWIKQRTGVERRKRRRGRAEVPAHLSLSRTR